MTPQEALYWHTHNGATIQQEIEIESIIIDALNKQIPKKPTISVHRYLYNGEETSAIPAIGFLCYLFAAGVREAALTSG